MFLLRNTIGNKTDITICVAIADIHILRTAGKNFFEYIVP